MFCIRGLPEIYMYVSGHLFEVFDRNCCIAMKENSLNSLSLSLYPFLWNDPQK